MNNRVCLNHNNEPFLSLNVKLLVKYSGYFYIFEKYFTFAMHNIVA